MLIESEQLHANILKIIVKFIFDSHSYALYQDFFQYRYEWKMC